MDIFMINLQTSGQKQSAGVGEETSIKMFPTLFCSYCVISCTKWWSALISFILTTKTRILWKSVCSTELVNNWKKIKMVTEKTTTDCEQKFIKQVKLLFFHHVLTQTLKGFAEAAEPRQHPETSTQRVFFLLRFSHFTICFPSPR